MESNRTSGPVVGKASSLTDAAAQPAPGTNPSDPKKPASPRPPRNGHTRRRIRVLDIVLLLLLVGLIGGGFHGYSALRDLYGSRWETREVEYCVEMKNIGLDMVKYNAADGRPVLNGQELWSNDHTDADCLGTVTDVRTVLVQDGGGKSSLTLYLTVTATAQYWEGHGYRMGATMLLAGTGSTYRLKGLSAEGTIISLTDKSATPSEGEGDIVLPDQQSPAAGE